MDVFQPYDKEPEYTEEELEYMYQDDGGTLEPMDSDPSDSASSQEEVTGWPPMSRVGNKDCANALAAP